MASATDEPGERELFGVCLELTPEERRVYLARACRGRPELRRRIESLLAAHRRAEGETPAASRPPADPVGEAPDGAPRPRSAGAPRTRRIALHPAAAGAGALLLLAATAAGVAVWRAREARYQVRSVEDVNAFLVAALRDAAPYGEPGRPASVLDLLHRARAQMEAEPGRPPEARVELLSILGEALLAHEDPAAAEGALGEAVSEAERSLGAGHRLTLRARTLLTSVHRLRGRTERLGEELDLVLPALRAAPGELPEELVVALQNLAHVEIERGRYGAAEAAAEEGLRKASELLGPRHPETASAAVMLARVCRPSREAEVALARTEEAYRLTRDVYRGAPDHPRVLEAEVLYGRALADAGRLADGVRRVESAARRAAEAFGSSSRRAGLFAGELARLRLRRGEIGRALEGSAAALAVLEGHYGREALEYADALELRGEALLAARRAEEAAAHLARAAELVTGRLGASHERVRGARASHALARAYGGDVEDAAREIERVAGAGGPLAGRGAGRWEHAAAVVRRLAGEPAQALRMQQERLASLAPGPGADPDRMHALAEIGLAQIALGRHDEATTPLLRALALFETLHAEVTPDRADVLVALGRARLAQGRPAEALEPLEAADRFWREHEPASPWAAEAAHWLARCRDARRLRAGGISRRR